MRSAFILAVVTLCCATVCPDGQAQEAPELTSSVDTAKNDPAQTDDVGPADPDAPLRYSVEFVGLPSESLADRLKKVSPLFLNRRNGAETAAQLGRRVREDVAVAERLLRAEGFYDAQASPQIKWSSAASGVTEVALVVNPGRQYLFEAITIDTGTETSTLPLEKILALEAGAPVRAAAVLEAEERLRLALPQQGYPFAVIGARDIIVDHDTTSARYRLPIELGARAVFGVLTVESGGRTKPTHLMKLARFKPGDPFRQERVDDLRQALLTTGLFAEVGVEVVRDEQATADGQAIANVRVVTRPAQLRSFGVAVGYGTGQGPRLDASWQHRDLFGGEERLTILGRLATQDQSLRFDMQKSNFRKRDQSLLARLHLIHEDTDAFEVYQVNLGASIERRTDQFWQKKWVYSYGAELELSQFEFGPKLGLVLVGALPTSLRLDLTDDLFDPTRGFRVSGAITPEFALEGNFSPYVRADFATSGYVPIGSRVVMAGRARTAILWGTALANVPTNRRLFAGGGGSIRGYAYQGVGPKDINGDPTGGASLTEFSTEARVRVTDTWGAVVFVDAGTVSTVRTPSLNGLRWGAGAGVRYFAPFGPIRIDVATPLNRRPGDSVVGIYVSIGQSF